MQSVTPARPASATLAGTPLAAPDVLPGPAATSVVVTAASPAPRLTALPDAAAPEVSAAASLPTQAVAATATPVAMADASMPATMMAGPVTDASPLLTQSVPVADEGYGLTRLIVEVGRVNCSWAYARSLCIHAKPAALFSFRGHEAAVQIVDEAQTPVFAL